METATGSGDSLFMRADRTKPAWRLLMPIREAWAGHPAADFSDYACGPQRAAAGAR